MDYTTAYDEALEYFDGDELAANVFLGKYALTDDSGDILEPTPEHMHRRLAGEFARIEAKYPNPLSEEEIFSYLDRFKYIVPQGSPMAGIGNPYQVQSISNCFVEGTEVHTKRGVKRIESIEIGDEVVTHNGRYRKVVQVHKNLLNNRQIYNLKAYRTPAIKVTGNHKFMSISKEQIEWGESPQFNSLDYLRVGDYIQIPDNNDEEEVGPLDLLSIFSNGFSYGDKTYEVDQNLDRFRLITVGKNGSKKTHSHYVPNKIYIDQDFAYFLGLWLGDGCIFGENTNLNKTNQRNRNKKVHSSIRGITFTFGSHEEKIIEFTCRYLNTMELPYDLNHNDRIDGTTQIVVHSPALGYAFDHYFGRGFEGKRLDASVFSWGRKLISSLFQGIVDSDGTITKAGEVRVVLANKSLIKQFYHAGRSRGLLVGYSESQNTARLDLGRSDHFRTNSNKTYPDSRVLDEINCNHRYCIEIDGKTFVQIRDKTPTLDAPEYVYTFGVEDDHSYSVEGLISLNCFVVPSVEDSYAGIMMTDQQLAQIMKRRGGVGVDISNLRPKGLRTNNAAGTTDGIGVFMERFSNTTREVAQSGRRGALMISISVHHPEIETFINVKRDMKRVTGANISIRLSNDFMNAVKNKEEYEMRWPVDSENPVMIENADAEEIWTQIIESAHATAEPGLLFWDNIIERSPADCYPGFETISTNPCGELPLSAGDSCRLLLVNVLSFVKDPFGNPQFDYENFAETCFIAQRLMDDMIDLELENIDKIIDKIDNDPESDDVKYYERLLWNFIRAACFNGRRTGLGVTAVGDAVAAMCLRYGSDESIEFIEEVYKTLAVSSYDCSITLAEERGAFPAFDYELEKDHEFINQILEQKDDLKERRQKFGRRNIANTTTAPAGSVSVLTQTTSGIEPTFMTSYTRRKKINPNDKNSTVDFIDDLGDKWQEFTVYHHGFKNWMDITGKTNVEDSPYYLATANDVDWVAKVKAQAAAQRWICHAISNTTNIPEDTPVEVVKDIYMTGYESGCKGVTVYRDGSRSGVLVNPGSESKETFKTNHAPKRPIELECEVHHMTVLGERWIMFVGTIEGKPYELMGGLSRYVSIPKRVRMGKIVKVNGTTAHPATYDFYYDYEDDPEDATIIKDINNAFDNATYAAFTRTISLALRHGTPVRYVVEQIQKGAEKEDDLFSFSKAASRVLKHYIEDGIAVEGRTCADCGSESIIYEEGCMKCVSCGSSKCN